MLFIFEEAPSTKQRIEEIKRNSTGVKRWKRLTLLWLDVQFPWIMFTVGISALLGVFVAAKLYGME